SRDERSPRTPSATRQPPSRRRCQVGPPGDRSRGARAQSPRGRRRCRGSRAPDPDPGRRWAATDRAGSRTWSLRWEAQMLAHGAIREAGLPETRGLATATAAIAIALPSDPAAAISHAYDEGRAAERLLVAASMLGIGAGISWIRSDVRPAIASLLALPDEWM